MCSCSETELCETALGLARDIIALADAECWEALKLRKVRYLAHRSAVLDLDMGYVRATLGVNVEQLREALAEFYPDPA